MYVVEPRPCPTEGAWHQQHVRSPQGMARLLGTISFRLTAAYAAVFTVSMLLLFGVIYWRTAGFAADELDNAIELEFSLLIDAEYTELAVRTLHSLYNLDKA